MFCNIDQYDDMQKILNVSCDTDIVRFTQYQKINDMVIFDITYYEAGKLTKF